MAERQKISVWIVFVIVILMVLGLYVFKKPAVTGKVIQGQETVFSENLNLKVNESGTYEWQVKNPGSIKSLKMSGSVTSNGTARVYIEKNGTRQLLFDSSKQLFDVDLRVLPEYKKIFQGDEILIQIILFNLRGFGSGDVNVKYSISDSKKDLIAAQEESVFVETQAKFVRKLEIPAEIKPGTYVAFVDAYTNKTKVGASSDTFEVMSKYQYKYPQELRMYLIIGAVVMVTIIVFIFSISGLAKLKKRQKISELKKKMPLERIGRLEKELKALEEARRAGFISEESYQKEKKRLENLLSVHKK